MKSLNSLSHSNAIHRCKGSFFTFRYCLLMLLLLFFAIPVHIYAGEQDFRDLFSLINLQNAELSSVKANIESGDYEKAVDEYVSILAERFAEFGPVEEFTFWLYGVSNADELLDGKLTFVKYGDVHTRFTIEIGEPGNINFFKRTSPDYDASMRDISSMQWVNKYAEAYRRNPDVKYLHGWFDTWDDFVQNWENQYALIRQDPEIWGRRPDGRRLVVGIDWLNAQLYLAWRLETIADGLVSVFQTASKAGHIDQIDRGKLARLLVRTVTAEAERSRRFIENPSAFVPNQMRHLAHSLFDLSLYLNDFKDSVWWREKSIPVYTLTHQPDGTDREHSLNYFRNNLAGLIESIIRYLPEEQQDEQYLAYLKQRSSYRDRFLPSIVRPDGILPIVGKNNVWRDYGQTKPLNPPSKNFDSIYFPYGGFAVMRDGWQQDSLYLFMKISRPSLGHWRSQDGGLQLSAYGRNLLISSTGEVYDSRDSEFGWANYWYSAVGDNTILVDGYSSLRVEGDYDKLDDYLWHNCDRYGLMQTKIEDGYGGGFHLGDFRRLGSKSPEKPDDTLITDTTHSRTVHFLRDAQCWIITDFVKSELPREFTQTWCFGPEYNEDEVITDMLNNRIYTKQSDAPNLSLYQASSQNLSYEKYYGLYEENMILGWIGFFEDRDNWQYTPAADTHVNWNSQGDAVVITLAVPRKDSNIRVESFQDISNGQISGFNAKLDDGTIILYRTSLEKSLLSIDDIQTNAESILVVSCPQGEKSGVVLGADMFDSQEAQYQNFTFELSESEPIIEAIHSPQTFRWGGEDELLKPLYRMD